MNLELEKVSSIMGYESMGKFFVKFVFPIIAGSFAVFLIFLFIPLFPKYYAYVMLVLGLSFLFLYPYAMYGKVKLSIEENLHFFITYAGTISTMDISTSLLFKKIAAKKVFGQISENAKKIHYLSRSWNLGFSKACRKIGKLSPSKVFSDFLDRFAVVMDFGENLEQFLMQEQTSVMDDYETEYKKSLENIKMLQNLFISLTISVAFIISIGLLLPLVLGTPMSLVIKLSLLGMISIDVLVFIMIKGFIPSDKIPHSLNIKTEGMKRVTKWTYIMIPITIILTIIMVWWDPFPFMINAAIGLTPLALIGIFAILEERMIKRRELNFPQFIRTLGGAVEIRSGAVVSSLFALRVHDFGLINKMVTNIYRRLKIGSDKMKSWVYFAAETGSHLIYHFSKIFSESVYLGGKADKIGEIVSDNFQRLLSLRKLRLQLSSGLRGAFYGSVIGLSSAIFVSAEIANSLSSLFNQPVGDGGDSITSLLSSVTPTVAQVDMSSIAVYIGILVIFHSFVSSILMKLIDGGFKSSAMLDFIVMVWLGAIVSIVIPNLTQNLLPDLSTVFSGG